MWTRIVALASLSAFSAACAGEGQRADDTPADPPSLRIDELEPAGRAPARPPFACVERGRDADGTILVTLGRRTRDGQLANWTLAPYQGCGVAQQCGVVLLTVLGPDDTSQAAFSVAAAATIIPVPFGDLPDGAYTIRAELRDQLGITVPEAGAGYSTEERVTVRGSCTGDAGTRDVGTVVDAATDAGSDSGPSLDASVPVGDAEAGAADGGSSPGDAAPYAPVDASGGDAALDAPTDG